MKNKTFYKIKGFTLPELMITVLIVSVLIVLGAPAMRTLIQGRQLVGQATDVASAISYARSAATSHSKNVVICASADGVSCSGATNWTSGWIIFVDNGPTMNSFESAEDDEILKVEGAMNGKVTLTANYALLPFSLSGESKAAGPMIFHLCSENAATANTEVNKSRLITVNLAGSVNIAMGTATCP